MCAIIHDFSNTGRIRVMVKKSAKKSASGKSGPETKYSGRFAENRRARFDYEIIETFQAGIVLSGFEVKSVRAGKVSITGAHCGVLDGEMKIIGMTIDLLQPKNAPEGYEPSAPRTLLLSKKEREQIARASKERGATCVPLAVFTHKNLIKVDVAIVRGKKLRDKRETIKKRDVERDVRRGV